MKTIWAAILLFATVTAVAQSHDTVHLYFPLDKTQLTERSTKLIDSLISNNWMEHNKRITVLGYADYLGTDDYDKAISIARAKNVEDYLVLSGITQSDITRVLGKGKVNRAVINGKKGYQEDRKVDIIFDARIDTPEIPKYIHYLRRLDTNQPWCTKTFSFTVARSG